MENIYGLWPNDELFFEGVVTGILLQFYFNYDESGYKANIL